MVSNVSLLLLSVLSLPVLVFCDHKPDRPLSALSLIPTKTVSDDSDSDQQLTIDSSHEGAESRFQATHEWQPIREGQVIPAGLHVRINLETGVKEAKILGNEEEVDSKTQIIDKHKKVAHLEGSSQAELDKIGQQIKQVMEDSIFAKTENISKNSNFRSINEIKKEFNEINVKMHSESELLKTLLLKYNQSSIKERQTLLSDIEYLVHSIDVARDLVKMGGIALLVKDLNSTDSRLRAQIAFTLGSAINGNPRVQIEALKVGTLKELLLLLQSDLSFDVKKKCLYAISSLVRQFPIAQKSLITEYGALSIFANLFQQSDIKSDIDSIKLSAKVVTLLNDLFIERRMTSKYASDNQMSQLKLKQYNEVQLEEGIVRHGFCYLIPNLLNSPDIVIQEKTIEAMNTLSVLCKQQFNQFLDNLKRVTKNYKVLTESESHYDSNDSFYNNLYESSLKLISNLESKDEL